MPISFLSLNDLSYVIPQTGVLFEGVSFGLVKDEKVAIVGDNGVGKTTLLKLIVGEISPFQGSINVSEKIAYLPQITIDYKGEVAEVLKISDILFAIKKVSSGNFVEKDYEIIGENWDIEDEVFSKFEKFGISHIDLSDEFSKLSGGEKEKILLIRNFISDANILIFDEPTNNLDIFSRKVFLEEISKTKKSVIIVSHDRELLNSMNVILELSSEGISRFSGNYNFYEAEKEKIREAKLNRVINLKEVQKNIVRTKSSNQTKADRSARTGKKNIKNRRFSSIHAGAMKGLSEISNAKKNILLDVKYEDNSKEIKDIELSLLENVIKIPLPEKSFVKNKIIDIKNMNFSYGIKKIFQNFSLFVAGGERIVIRGNNGSGKTTLLRIILGELQPENSECLNVFGSAIYLNQSLDFLKRDKAILDNIIDYNIGIGINEAYSILANFGFRNDLTLKKVSVLSGGELLKVCLAKILGTTKQPDLIILDEPTNNLDIRSVEVLESVLRQYQGALIVVSHDEVFIKNIKISREVII